ncbi:MAG: hypothetical protein U9Q07_03920 [Planctomycetota bacterium]|nr:hypothetical protein [Planctomycetota bacterium]
MILIPIWALTLVANILEFTGRKIAANKKREQAKMKLAAKKERVRLKELEAEKARLKKLQAEHLLATRAEFLRVEKSKAVAADIKMKIIALERPVDDNPYGEEVRGPNEIR